MRILILSCSTGGGHNACAAAIEEHAKQCGAECTVRDSLHFVSPKLERFVTWGHVCMYRHVSPLFGWGYRFSERHRRMFDEGGSVYRLMGRGAQRLNRYIRDGEFDAVICTHVFAALTLRKAVTDHSLNIPTAFVATDYTCSPGVEAGMPDVCFVPDEALLKEFRSVGTCQLVSGIPVRRMFYNNLSSAQAKSRLGIPHQHRHLVMSCGSMGCGPMKKLARYFAEHLEEGQHLSIVCGTNQKLYEYLVREYEGTENLHVLGFVQDMSALLDGADLYLTKPGGISVTEAGLKGVPMVFVDAVAGCEEYNLRHFEKLGGALGGRSVREIGELCIWLLEDKEKTRQMRKCLQMHASRQAAETIYETMEALYEKARC